jgi:hypothetical protein
MSIQTRFCGPASVGTVDVIKLVRARAGLTLRAAKALVDRCVFEGETVSISGLSLADAVALIQGLRSLHDAPPIDVSLED